MIPAGLPEKAPAGAGSTDDLFQILKGDRLESQQSYFLGWLSASPAQMRSLKSLELNPEQRFEAVLSALSRERNMKVIPLKKSRG